MSDDSRKSENGQDIQEILNFVRGSIAKHTDEDAGYESSDSLPFPVDEDNNEQEAKRWNTSVDSIQNVPIEYDSTEEDADYGDGTADYEDGYAKNDGDYEDSANEQYADYGSSEDERSDNTEDYSENAEEYSDNAEESQSSEEYADGENEHYGGEEYSDSSYEYDGEDYRQDEYDSTYSDTDTTSEFEADLHENEAEQPDNEAIEGKDLDKPLIYIKENDTDLSELFGSELTYSREIDITSIVSRLNSLNNDEDDYTQTVTGRLSGIERDAEAAAAEDTARRKAEEEKDMTVRTPVISDDSGSESTDESTEPVVIYTNYEEAAAEETSPTGSSEGEDSFISGNDMTFGEQSEDKQAQDADGIRKDDSEKAEADNENEPDSDTENENKSESHIEEIFSQSRPENKDNGNTVEAADSKNKAFDFAIPSADNGSEGDGDEKSKKSRIIIPVIIVLLLFGAAAFFYFFVLNKNGNQGNASSAETSVETDMLISQLVSEVESKIEEASAVSSEASEPEEPVYTGPYSNLTGLPIDENKINARPVAFMMNNIEAAQPLLGISKADIVYELVVEGGITRLLGVFGDPYNVSTIGSIRSARPDFIYLAKGLDAIFFHVGTSVQARDLLDTGIITSFDLGYYDSMCWRDTYRMNNLGYEHSLVTSGDSIITGLGNYNVRTDSDTNKGFNFSDASQVISGNKAVSLTARFSPYKTTSFEYDEKKKVYGVYQFGMAQYDGAYDVNNTVTNVITISTNVYQIDDEGHMSVDVIGSGEGYYMSHGRIIPITWAKTSAAGAMIFYTVDGKELELFRGRTYVCVVPRGTDAVSWE